MLGDFRLTSRLSTVSVCMILLVLMSIKEYVQYLALDPGESQRPSPTTTKVWSLSSFSVFSYKVIAFMSFQNKAQSNLFCLVEVVNSWTNI